METSPSEQEINRCREILALLPDQKGDPKFGPLIHDLFESAKKISPKFRQQHTPKEKKKSGLDQYRDKRKVHFQQYSQDPLAKLLSPQDPLLIEEEPEKKAREEVLSRHRPCYICRTQTRRVHWFYFHMCVSCGDLNYQKRLASCDLSGRIALVTGARVKIGFEIALKLLRAGAQVLGTSRFPVDTLTRFAAESDFLIWKNRLRIAHLDLLSRTSIETLVTEVEKFLDRQPLAILINNAAQTLARPPSFYAREEKLEQTGLLPSSIRTLLLTSGEGRQTGEDLSLLECDSYGQAIDPSEKNAWVTQASDLSIGECVEVHLINAIAPLYLIQKLTPRLKNGIIINVTSMEGSFAKVYKSPYHVHTNMAKASMNMITRTLGAHYLSQHSIQIHSVDTGWIDDMTPTCYTKIESLPLDVVDGASRVLDPVFEFFGKGKIASGLFWKDYSTTSW